MSWTTRDSEGSTTVWTREGEVDIAGEGWEFLCVFFE